MARAACGGDLSRLVVRLSATGTDALIGPVGGSVSEPLGSD
jgi:hypothetical protein